MRLSAKQLVRGLLTLAALFTPGLAQAAYNANIGGKITNIRVYDTGVIFIRLDTQPSTHPQCATDYFAIDPALDPNIRALLLSRALTAKTTGETVNIGYDAQGNCAHSRMRIHEIGL
jgi:hypothetical protein